MVLTIMKHLFVFTFLSFFSLRLLAQEAVEEEIPRWQAGVDVSTPLLLQFDNYAGWDRAFLLEALLQLRVGGGVFWPQLYSGYFTGKRSYPDSRLLQSGFYLKPGFTLQFGRRTRLKPFMELNALYSWGQLQGKVKLRDPIFGDAILNDGNLYDGGGGEIGIGFYPASFGPYRLRLSAAGFIGGQGGADSLRYLPGAGSTNGFIIYWSGAVRLHLLRPW